MGFLKSGISKKRTVVILLIISVMIAFICSPERYIKSVYSGITLFVVSVLPALFPFFFFTKLLTGLGMSGAVSSLFEKPIKKLYNTNSAGGYIFTMSIMSGYPVGAKLISDFYSERIFTLKDCKKVSSFTSTSGPLFVVGTVGTLMLSSPKAGYVLFVCHALGAMLNGLLYRGKSAPVAVTAPLTPQRDDNFLNASITSSILSVLVVGGYIAIFSMVIDVALDLKIVDFFARIVSPLLTLAGIPAQTAKPVIISLIEITRGCQSFADSGVDIKIILPFIAGLLSFGGLSITFQSLTFLRQCKVSVPFYFITKTTQAIFSFIIALIACAILY